MSPSDDTIDLLYEASVDPARWQDAVEHLGAVFNAATGALYVENHGDAFSLLDIGVMFGHSASAITAYGDYFCARNPFNGALYRSDSIGVLTDTFFDARFGNEKRFQDGEYYCDWVRPQNLRHVLGRRIRSRGSAVLCAAFWRPADAGAYSDQEMARFETTIRHLDRAIEIGGRLQTAEAEMETMLGRMSSAVFTLGFDRRVRQSNALADVLLQSGGALRLAGGRLQTALAQDQVPLDRLIACALDARFASWAEHARVTIHRADGGMALTAKAVAVAQRFNPFRPDQSASMILIVEGQEAETAAMGDRLRRRFGLSPAQIRVALALRAGRTLQETADLLGLGRETVRTHLKAIFERTGTHRQAELIGLLHREQLR